MCVRVCMCVTETEAEKEGEVSKEVSKLLTHDMQQAHTWCV